MSDNAPQNADLPQLGEGFVERRGADRPFSGPPVVQPPGAVAAPGLERLGEVTVELSVEVGRARMTLTQALGLGPGSIVGLDRMHGEPADLLCNGKRIARGEVVVVDDEFGLRITEVAAPAVTRAPAVAPVEPAAMDAAAPAVDPAVVAAA